MDAQPAVTRVNQTARRPPLFSIYKRGEKTIYVDTCMAQNIIILDVIHKIDTLTPKIRGRKWKENFVLPVYIHHAIYYITFQT